MKSKRQYLDYLNDMLVHAQLAESFVQGVSFDAFANNKEKVFAVIRALEVVGEAAARIPQSLRNQYPTIPWKDIVGMRNILIHEYFGVDLDVIWKTLKIDIPPLIHQLTTVIEEL